MVLFARRIACGQVGGLFFLAVIPLKDGAVVAVEERVRTDPAAPIVAAWRHERHHPDLLVPTSMKFADHGKYTNCAADMGLRVLHHMRLLGIFIASANRGKIQAGTIEGRLV